MMADRGQVPVRVLVTKLDEERGKLLLNEIMVSGNFGKFDESLKDGDEDNLIAFNLVALKRQLRFLRYYPFDIITIPFFKIWHWCLKAVWLFCSYLFWPQRRPQ